jgi:hypothetical protein
MASMVSITTATTSSICYHAGCVQYVCSADLKLITVLQSYTAVVSVLSMSTTLSRRSTARC